MNDFLSKIKDLILKGNEVSVVSIAKFHQDLSGCCWEAN